MSRPTTHHPPNKLSKETIVSAAVAILDAQGERGLTFRALAAQLKTGAGALYWHVAGKDELLTAAADQVVATALTPAASPTPRRNMQALSLRLFEAIEAHPWLGGQLCREPWQMAVLRIFEGYGQQLAALGLPPERQFHAASALVNYLLGLAGQYAAGAAALGYQGTQGQDIQGQEADREQFLKRMAQRWQQLDAQTFPFAHYLAQQLPQHDDRLQFLAGLDLILDGIEAQLAG